VSDHFARLNQPRRPWLDEQSLKQEFLKLSAETHPDRFHQANETEKSAASRCYAELNAAYQCLREPRDRLRHLIELELGSKPKDLQEIPSDLADLFIAVAQVSRDAKKFLGEKAAVTSPLMQVQFLDRSQEWMGQISSMQKQIAARQAALVERLRSLDSDWMKTSAEAEARPRLLVQLEEIYRLMSFYGRWQSQLQEALVRLMI